MTSLQFADFPAELRLVIWRHALARRSILNPVGLKCLLFSDAPAISQSCHEAREMVRATHRLVTLPRPHHSRAKTGNGRLSVWLDFSSTVILLGSAAAATSLLSLTHYCDLFRHVAVVWSDFSLLFNLGRTLAQQCPSLETLTLILPFPPDSEDVLVADFSRDLSEAEAMDLVNVVLMDGPGADWPAVPLNKTYFASHFMHVFGDCRRAPTLKLFGVEHHHTVTSSNYIP